MDSSYEIEIFLSGSPTFHSLCATMSAVSEIMSPKGVVTLRANFNPTALDAIRHMLENNVGSVVIVDSNGKPEGIVTERDVIRMVAESKAAPGDTSIGDIMSSPVITVKAYDSIDTAAAVMAKKGIKHAVVVEDDGTMAGVVSVTDIAKKLSKILMDDYNRFRSIAPAIGIG